MEKVKRVVLGQYIPEHRLPILKAYKYNGVDKSIMGRLVLRHWWEWFARLIPDWMAYPNFYFVLTHYTVSVSRPNLVTLIGFMFSLSGFLSVLYTSHGMTQPCPPLVQAYIAFVMFGYQTFDAVDGKHARRTGTSSPLGQLFDHGCDAINLVFTVFMTWAAFDMRPSIGMALNGLFCTFNHY
jgi:hypothetical protein